MAAISEIWGRGRGDKMKKEKEINKDTVRDWRVGAWNSDKEKWRELTSTSWRSERKKERKEATLVQKNAILDAGVIKSSFISMTFKDPLKKDSLSRGVLIHSTNMATAQNKL